MIYVLLAVASAWTGWASRGALADINRLLDDLEDDAW